jgi:hypothetical protein
MPRGNEPLRKIFLCEAHGSICSNLKNSPIPLKDHRCKCLHQKGHACACHCAWCGRTIENGKTHLEEPDAKTAILREMMRGR